MDNDSKPSDFFYDVTEDDSKKASELFDWLSYKFIEHPYTDLHFNVSKPIYGRVGGMILPILDPKVPHKISYTLSKALFRELLIRRSGVVDDADKGGELFTRRFMQERSGNFACAYSVDKGEVRFRVNAHFDQHGVGLSLRVLPDSIPPLKSLGFTEETYRIINQRAVGKTGLIILVGPVNSGKSTTMASFINEGNQKMIRKVLTLESPIEYIYKTFDPADPENTMSYRSLVIQREIGVDCVSFTNGLKEALRQDAQAILVGELLSEEEAHMALMAALTGHLVFCTVHATSAIDALSRIASFFPPDRRTAAVATLSRVLSCVCFQMLLPTAIVKEGATKAMKASGGILAAEDVERAHSEEQKAKAAGNSESRMASRCLAYEFLDGTPEVLRSISQWAETGDSNKMIQIESEMSIDGKGHCPFPRSLRRLQDEGKIDDQTFRFALETFKGI